MSKFTSWQDLTVSVRKTMPHIVVARGDNNINMGGGVELPGYSPELQTEIRQWCSDQFGRSGICKFEKIGLTLPSTVTYTFNRRRRWAMLPGSGKFYFKYPTDAFEFKMRWG